MKIKKGDFVKLEYTGKVKETNKIFDTTKHDLAKKQDFYDPNQEYEPVTIVAGGKQIIQGIDETLIEHEIGDEYEINIKPEKAFGKRKKELIQLIPKKQFEKHGVKPVPGLAVRINNRRGFVRTVSGGRVIVDFNNPLAGKELKYEIKILDKVKDPEKQSRAIVTYYTRIKDPEVKLKKGKLKVKTKMELPEFLTEKLTEIIKENIPEVKKVEFKSTQKQHVRNTQKQDVGNIQQKNKKKSKKKNKKSKSKKK